MGSVKDMNEMPALSPHSLQRHLQTYKHQINALEKERSKSFSLEPPTPFTPIYTLFQPPKKLVVNPQNTLEVAGSVLCPNGLSIPLGRSLVNFSIEQERHVS